MVAKPRLVTAEELMEMPDDGHRYELVRGELRKIALGGAQHPLSGMNMAASLHHFSRTNNLGRVYGADGGFLLAINPDHVRAPDAAFVRRERGASWTASGLARPTWPLK